MLKKLEIDNFALVEHAEIHFNGGFTVITGETGSGKSILLNSLNLILGERANYNVIGSSKDKSVVEAEIDIEKYGLAEVFEKYELDYFNQSIFRREIYKQGRSRAFINDVPVQLSILKEITSKLIHIHSQYNTLELKDPEYQLYVLDVLSDCIELRTEYNLIYKKISQAKSDLALKLELFSKNSAEADYNAFQLEELKNLQLYNIDYDKILEEFDSISNADTIKEVLSEISNILSPDSGIINDLSSLTKKIGRSSGIGVIGDLPNRMESVLIELEDIHSEVSRKFDDLELDPEKLIDLSSKIDAFNRVAQKHNKQTQEELKLLERELSQGFESNDELSALINDLKNQISQDTEFLNKLSEQLHLKRTKAIPEIESQLRAALSDLKLNDTKLSFQLSKLADFGKYGNTKLNMLFSPNKGISPVPIHQAASGGELSRLMLALQNLIAQKSKLPTIFFDEIDTGVSGDVANKIGITLNQLGKNMQVIAITHLPQVASKGEQHLCVSKSIKNGVTTTSVQELTSEERINEVAKLMSGEVVNEAAIENAKALMNQ
jgi:DNA repair protein RecN (Recombination protein N)